MKNSFLIQVTGWILVPFTEINTERGDAILGGKLMAWVWDLQKLQCQGAVRERHTGPAYSAGPALKEGERSYRFGHQLSIKGDSNGNG